MSTPFRREPALYGCLKRKLTRRQFISHLNMAAAGLVLGRDMMFQHSPRMYESSRVAIARTSSYDRNVLRSVLEAIITDLGGLGELIRPGDRVGIKINLTGGSSFASEYQRKTGLHPGETFWTHPDVLRITGELIKDAGASEIYVLEAIYDWESYNDFGYREVADYLGATLLDLNQPYPYNGYAVRPVSSNPYFYETLTQNGIFNDLNCLVSLAKSKRHTSVGVTHGIKNLVGTLPLPVGLYNDGESVRMGIHRHKGYDGDTESNLCRVLMDINRATPIHLVINDAIKTVLGGEGPWTALTPVAFDTLIASKDPVAADVIATQAIGFDPMAADHTEPFPLSINYMQLAGELGMGSSDLNQITTIQSFPTSIEHSPGVPEIILGDERSYPNPFHASTTIEFSLSRTAFVSLNIFNLTGRRLRKLVARSLPVGRQEIVWDGKDDLGNPVPSGMYLAVIRSDNISKTIKMTRTP